MSESRKLGLLAILLTAIAIAGYGQTRQHGSSANMQMAMPPVYLGIDFQLVDAEKAKALKLKETAGLEVTRVRENSPAAKAGIQVQDVILEIGGQKVGGQQQFVDVISSKASGTKITLTISRAGATRTLSATLEPRPQDLVFSALPPGGVFPAIPLSPEDLQAMIAASAPRAGYDGAELSPQLAAFFGVQNGVLVFTVYEKTPAERAGMKAGDIVTKVNGFPVSSPREISAILRQSRKVVSFTVIRNKKEMALNVEISLNRSPFPPDEAVN